MNSFRKDYENIFTLKKKYFKSLSRGDRQCEDRDDYSWGDCLDESFYWRKGRYSINLIGHNYFTTGCQDPWHVNPKVPLPACTNVSEIAASYSQGPTEMNSWDNQFWERPYMTERDLAVMEREGRVCKTPCYQTYFNLEPSYVHRNRYFN